MLPQSTIAEVARLLREEKLSQRKIAERLQISRGTVGAIASGGRGLHGRLPKEDEPQLFVPCSPPKRCPQCGYRVYLPCLICNTRQFQDRAGVSLSKEVVVQAPPAGAITAGGSRSSRARVA